MRGSSKCWLLIGMMAWGALAAQDIHFSQVDADPVLLNPAYSGFYQGAGRFGLIYRNQWASVSVPYQTFAVTGEMALWRSSNQRNGLSAGLLFFNDHAGTLGYGTTSGHVSVAYYTALNRAGSSVLSVGLEGAYAQSGFDPSRVEMEDPSDLVATNRVGYPLLAVGAAWYYQPTGDFHTKVGFSLRNANRPNISYGGLDNVYLERRYSLFARAEYRRWQSVSLMPVVLGQIQGRHRELVYGMDVKWYIEEGGAREVSLRCGLAFRHGDAVIANVMMEYGPMVFTFCYDANVSGLAAASHTVGAFEGGVVYRMSKGAKKRKAIKCPVY